MFIVVVESKKVLDSKENIITNDGDKFLICYGDMVMFSFKKIVDDIFDKKMVIFENLDQIQSFIMAHTGSFPYYIDIKEYHLYQLSFEKMKIIEGYV